MSLLEGVDDGFNLLNRPTGSLTQSQQQAAGQIGAFGFLPEKDFSVGGTVQNVLHGFVSGFSGINFGDDPENSAEAIARSVGGVAGFLGFVPGPGLAGKLGGSTIAKAFGATRLSAALKAAPTVIQSKSVPLFVADKVIESSARLAKNNAFLNSMKFLQNGRTQDFLTETARFGIASGVAAPWTEGVDEVALAVGLGALDGGGFQLVNSGVRKVVGQALANGTRRQRDVAEATIRGMANSLVSGLPATFMDAPLEVQVFEYLLGAGFGVIDLPYEVRRAKDYLGPKSRIDIMNVDKLPDFQSLEPAVKDEVLFQRESLISRSLNSRGDTEGAGVLARAFTELYEENYQTKLEELSLQGLDNETAHAQAVQFATDQTGVRFWDFQQENRSQELGSDLQGFFAETRPTIHHSGNPSGGERSVVYDAASNDLYIDKELLAREYDQQDAVTSQAEFTQRTILDEYFKQTSASDVDTQKLVDDTLSGFTKEEQPPASEPTPPSKAKYQSSFKSRTTDELVQDIGAREEVQRNVVATNDLIRAKSLEQEAVGDHDIPALLATPLDSFADGLVQSLDITSKDARALAYGAFSKEGQTWEGALQEVAGELSARAREELVFDGNHESRRALRRAWKLYSQNKATRQGFWNGSGITLYGENGLGRVDGSGRAITKSKAPTHLESALKRGGLHGELIVEKKESSPEGGRVKVDSIFDDDSFNSAQYLVNSYRSNKPFFAGTKDKGRNHHTEGFLFDKSQAHKLYSDKVASIERVIADLRAQGKRVESAEDSLNKLKESFREELKDAQLGKETPEDVFEALWLNNIRIIEEMNGGIPFEKMIEANALGTGKFIMGPEALNKRMQILDDGSPVADPKMYPEQLQQQGGMKAVVVKARGVSTEGIDKVLMRRYGKGGSLEDFIADHHLDGVVFERPDVFDSRLRDIGGDPGAGVVKGSTVFATEKEGMFIGKMAIFRAPEGMDSEMGRYGLHQIYMDSAAKQRGFRSEYNMHVKKDGTMQLENPDTNLHRAISPENIKSFVVPFAGQRMNLSVGEKVKKALTDQHAPSQLHTTLEDPAAIKQWMDTYVEPSYNGSDAANKLFYKHMATKDSSIIEKIDWDSVGVPELMKLYSGAGEEVMVDNGAYRAMVSHIINKEKEDPSGLELDIEGNAEDMEDLAAIQDFTSAADRILKLWDLSPATTQLDFVKPYVDAVFRNYVTKRLMRPKIPYSGKVIAGPADPFLRKKLDIKPGFVYLDEAWKNKKIAWLDGKETTLGKAYDQLQSATGKAKERMEDLLTFATIRVPADSPAGTRMLKIGGFTGRRGAGGTVHNEEMINLGGMDLDIDSFFIFQDPDRGGTADGKRPIKEFFESNRDQWNDANGVRVDSKPQENDKVYVKELEDFEKHGVATGAPHLLFSSSRGAYQGNKLLGIAATAGRRGSAWHQAALAGNNDALEVQLNRSLQQRMIKALGLPPNAKLNVFIDPVQDKSAFDFARMEAMNRAADAGDYPGFKQNKFTIGNLIGKELVDKVRVSYTYQTERGEVKRSVITKSPEVRQLATPAKTKMWKDMQAADYFASGRNYGGKLSLADAWKQLSRVIDLPSVPKGLDPDVHYSPTEAADRIGRMVREASGRSDISNEVIEHQLRGGRRETKPYTLSETMKGLQEMGDQLDLGNTYYQTLRLLAQTPFENRQGDISFVNQQGLQRLSESFNRVWREDTPEAELARRLTGRKALRVEENEVTDGWMAKQDIADIASSRIVYDAARAAVKENVDTSQLHYIANAVEDFKDLYKRAGKC